MNINLKLKKYIFLVLTTLKQNIFKFEAQIILKVWHGKYHLVFKNEQSFLFKDF